MSGFGLGKSSGASTPTSVTRRRLNQTSTAARTPVGTSTLPDTDMSISFDGTNFMVNKAFIFKEVPKLEDASLITGGPYGSFIVYGKTLARLSGCHLSTTLDMIYGYPVALESPIDGAHILEIVFKWERHDLAKKIVDWMDFALLPNEVMEVYAIIRAIVEDSEQGDIVAPVMARCIELVLESHTEVGQGGSNTAPRGFGARAGLKQVYPSWKSFSLGAIKTILASDRLEIEDEDEACDVLAEWMGSEKKHIALAEDLALKYIRWEYCSEDLLDYVLDPSDTFMWNVPPKAVEARIKQAKSWKSKPKGSYQPPLPRRLSYEALCFCNKSVRKAAKTKDTPSKHCGFCGLWSDAVAMRKEAAKKAKEEVAKIKAEKKKKKKEEEEAAKKASSKKEGKEGKKGKKNASSDEGKTKKDKKDKNKDKKKK